MKTDLVLEILGTLMFVLMTVCLGGTWIVLTLMAVGMFKRHTGEIPNLQFLGLWPIEAGAALYDFLKDPLFHDHDDQ